MKALIISFAILLISGLTNAAIELSNRAIA